MCDVDSSRYMNSDYDLKNFFEPTKNSSGEIAKARVKNANLPFLQKMYNGDPLEPLRCLLTGTPGWIDYPEFGTNKPKNRFQIDFDHIRQLVFGSTKTGTSLDKGWDAPSHLFRSMCLGGETSWSERTFFEFVTICPTYTIIHTFKTQDSMKNDITLKDYKKENWAWCLQSEENFNETKDFFKIRYFDVPYDFMVNHLMDINAKSIRARIDQFLIKKAA